MGKGGCGCGVGGFDLQQNTDRETISMYVHPHHAVSFALKRVCHFAVFPRAVHDRLLRGIQKAKGKGKGSYRPFTTSTRHRKMVSFYLNEMNAPLSAFERTKNM